MSFSARGERSKATRPCTIDPEGASEVGERFGCAATDFSFFKNKTCSRWRHETEPGRLDQSLSCRVLESCNTSLRIRRRAGRAGHRWARQTAGSRSATSPGRTTWSWAGSWPAIVSSSPISRSSVMERRLSRHKACRVRRRLHQAGRSSPASVRWSSSWPGALAIPTMPIAQYPTWRRPTVSVLSVYTGANAETVETAVTTPLEQAINGVEGML